MGTSQEIEPRKRRRRVEITTSVDVSALVVTLPSQGRRRALAHAEARVARPQPAVGCIFPVRTPSSVVNKPAFQIAKYTVPGDAVATDSVTFKGGTRAARFRLEPIFYGSAWLTAAPNYRDVMASLITMLRSPYLWELDQYGFEKLALLSPVCVNATLPSQHDTNEAATVVANLIAAGAVPESGSGDPIIYAVFYPEGTNVDVPACGWHYEMSGDWIAAIEFPDGAGAGATQTALDNIVRIFSHELVETVTDPSGKAPNQGWVMNRNINGGLEIGDACNRTDDFTGGAFVNAYWSQRSLACVIPQPNRIAAVSSTVEVLSETVVSTGSVTFQGDPFDIRTCLNGTYTYTNSFVAQRARLQGDDCELHQPTDVRVDGARRRG